MRANAETPLDCRTAREFGAEGIGLCRTEHMFFDAERIAAVRQMILAEDEAGRRAALAKLLPEQRGDFAEIFEIMAGLPVTIRLLDPPLHEFLPHSEEEFAEVAAAAGVGVDDAASRRAAELHESNPMLGHRGCRLGITYPEIYEMQARAIFEAALRRSRARTARRRSPRSWSRSSRPARELAIIRALIDAHRRGRCSPSRARRVDYLVGTMIELPRAALRAGEIAEEAEFFSFGTNDLTQTTLGVSRDDAGRFLADLCREGHLRRAIRSSASTSRASGELIALAAERGPGGASPDLKLGICGEHGGDPASIAFCEAIGLDYVSASPYRVPIARLAAAQAALREGLRAAVAAAAATLVVGGARRVRRAGARPGGASPSRGRRGGAGHSRPRAPRGAAPRRDSGPSIWAGEQGHAEDQAQHEGEQQDQPLVGREGGHRRVSV